MLCLAPPSGKTEHSKELNDISLQVFIRVCLTVHVLNSSVAAPVLKLLMPKVACLQCYNVIGKKRLSPISF